MEKNKIHEALHLRIKECFAMNERSKSVKQLEFERGFIEGAELVNMYYELKASVEANLLVLGDVSNSMLLGLPENTPLYKDSGLWQLRTDDMEDIIISQGVNEDDFAFIERCKSIDC